MSGQRTALAGQLQFWLDDSSVADWARARQQRFVTLPGDVNLGFGSGVIWLRVQVQRDAQAPADWWLEVAPGYLDEVTLWVESAASAGSSALPAAPAARQAGTRWPPGTTDMRYRHSLFHLDLAQPGVHTLWLRVATNNARIVHPVLWQLPALQQEMQTSSLLAGLFIGGMVCLALASMVLGLMTPQRLHFFCGGYLLAATLQRAAADGWLGLYFASVRNVQQDSLIAASLALSLALFMRVSLRLVQAPQHLPRLARGLEALAWAVCLLTLAALAAGQFGHVIAWLSVVALLCLAAMLALLAWLWRREPEARWVLLALSPVLLPAMLRVARNLAWLPSTAWVDASLPAGLLLHGLLYFWLVSRQQRRLHQQLQRDQAQALANAAVLDEQRQFMTLLSHELRSPLATLDGALSNLARQRPADGTGPLVALPLQAAVQAPDSARLQRMLRASARLKYVLDYCLSDQRLAAMGAHQSAAQQAWCAEQIVQEALRQIEPDARLQPLAPDGSSTPDLARAQVRGDLPLLGAALKNLLENALKYAATGSVQIGQRVSGGQLLLSVRDHGPGLDEQALAQLFQKFARGRVQAHLAGAGLGLYLAQQIVSRHGGELQVRNLPDGGVLALMRLPLSTPEA